MEVIHDLEPFSPPPAGVVLTIGNFDGVHRGHARIIEIAQHHAQRLGGRPVAMTFEPHPLAILAPERAPARLTTLEEKLALLEQLGVDTCIVLRSEPGLLAVEAVDFVARVVEHCRPRAFVEGPDFNFGRGRRGSIATLCEYARRWNYEVHAVPVVHCESLPTRPTISSTSIRQALVDGRLHEANAMLERPYRVVGTVAHGVGRGVELGFPTANLENIVHLLPQYAVYAAAAQLESGAVRLAAVNIGPQPTFDQERARVEAHILDLAGDLRGQRIGLHFLARLREQVRFATPAELVTQIERDVAATRTFAPALGPIRPLGLR